MGSPSSSGPRTAVFLSIRRTVILKRMLRTLQSIAARIAHQYDPVSVVLFGSCADGTNDAGSDVDLLVIKETEKRPIERSEELESILIDRAVPLDLVIYTPAEILDLFKQGSPFVDEIVATGKVLYMRKNTKAWINEAENELTSAAVLLEHGLHKASCYHSQQAAEKSLKAMLIEEGGPVKRTHDILELKNEVGKSVGSQVSVDDAVFINSIHKGRYPTEQGLLPHGEPIAADADRALKAAKRVFSTVSSAIG